MAEDMRQAGRPFDGYHRRDVPAPDPELTQVGPGTPCGEYLRRFWQPVAAARDLTETPLRVRILEEATAPKAASRPLIIRWAVPNDDTQTTNFELAQVDPAWRLSAEEVARPGFGQSADRPYAERQRYPADFDAQSSQRPIAVHALEHLASTDRGVIMLRRIVRDGIRAVRRGGDPWGIHGKDGAAVRTFAQDTVLRVPPAATAEADRRLLRRIGRELIGQA